MRPSRRWGQHFLVSPRTLDRTLDAASLSRDDSVLEVGAGIGTLTLGLADRAGWVTAVEVDRRLVSALEAIVGPRPNVRIVQGDILALPAEALFDGPAGAPRKVVANLPYNIASAVLTRLLEEPLGLAVLVVTVQREVAERIAARPGGRAYGRLSIAVQYRAVPRIIARISPGAFLPQPAVESALVELRPLPRPAVEVPDEGTFFRVVAAGFAQRRKTLHNSLASVLDQPREVVARALGEAGIDPRARAETLDLAAFGRLAWALAVPLRTAPPPLRPRGRGRRS
ncbi:MAG TPA: 16S rRNA (adenine(1518)-N(6)/adenine(1519)-N(6))-dimethyltransferase RsmA [bacterium]|nr:16S rRNA (adenine(1518)-N(6)/adenine(1519)-N(6))-dimethyltransferase RsmA [bacterium]